MLKVDPVFINSALVSAQNRQRYYWANWEFMAPSDRFYFFLIALLKVGLLIGIRRFVLMLITLKGAILSNILRRNRRQLVFELSKINPRCIDVSINENGVRPHKGDSRKSGISELGRLIFRDAKKDIHANHLAHAKNN